MCAGDRQRGDVHGDDAIQIQHPHQEEESAAYDRPENTHTHTLPFTICHQWTNPDHMAEAQTRLLSEWSLVEVMSVMICTTVVESTCF